MNLRKKFALAGASVLLIGGVVLPASMAQAAQSCEVVYTVNNWNNGFTANLTVKNTGDAWAGWTLAFALPNGETWGPGWSATWSASGQNVTAVPLDWNRNIANGGSTNIGFNGTWTGTGTFPGAPTAFTVNGVACNGGGNPGNQAPTVSLSSPTAGASFAQGATIPMAATASDPDGTINRVEFLIDGTVVGSDTTSPYSFTAPGPSATGNHTAAARAVDNGSPAASTTTPAVTFSVAGTTTPTIILPSTLSVNEGGTATLLVRRNTAPTANVVVTLTRTGDTSITVPASVTLTPANAVAGVSVTVSAAEDTDQVNGTATIAATATGHTGAQTAVTEIDNDAPPPTGRVDNPYANAGVYNNPDWRALAAAQAGGSRIANQPTGVWLDRIAAIAGTSSGRGLAAHLDEAVAQDAANGATPMVVQFVIYNLPGRDCSALASNGELGPTEIGRYQTDYINPIRDIFARPAYANLRIVAVIEIDSIPNLVTNVAGRPTQVAQCDVMNQNGNYITGVGYALHQLASVPNVYNYIDAGHHGWLGWSDNFGATATKLAQAANASGATPADVHGFITNTANYSALSEPFINVAGTINGQQVRQSAWVDFNNYNDELSFAQAFRTQLISAGFTGGGSGGIGMLIDTSRNGWGNCVQGPCEAMPNRPTAASTSTDLNTNINASRIDRRIHKGNWCNQAGAGLGERPRANPAAGIDAYVWIKPPGESDGSSSLIENPDGKGFDRMCDPTYGGNARNGNSMSGALPNSPLSGAFFPAQFQQLMANAFPAL